jgi:hypothetical protein
LSRLPAAAYAIARAARVGALHGRVQSALQVPAAQRGSAFVRRSRKDLDLIFALPFEPRVNRDNTVSVQNLRLQIESVRVGLWKRRGVEK